jgi:hypothetical protein
MVPLVRGMSRRSPNSYGRSMSRRSAPIRLPGRPAGRLAITVVSEQTNERIQVTMAEMRTDAATWVETST